MNTATALNLDRQESLREEVLRGLRAQPRRLECKLFYDLEGSRLFESICEQPEYYLTRCEVEILERQGAAIASVLGPGVTLVELGSGSSSKTRLLLDALESPAGYVPIDISGEFLEESAAELRRVYPRLPIAPVVADFTAAMPAVAELDVPAERVVTFFSGSSIGNFDPDAAAALMRSAAAIGGAEGCLLIAADLRKDPKVLEAAYDDAAGVTAAFNLNVLGRLNRDIGANFDVDGFEHRAVWNPDASRIEMHIVSRGQQLVRVGGVSLELAAGEAIVSEHCYKYTIDGFAEIGRMAGLQREALWTDSGERYSLQLFSQSAGS